MGGDCIRKSMETATPTGWKEKRKEISVKIFY
jgi:hypothetical protein